MTPEEHLLWHELFAILRSLAESKFEKGAIEHRGNGLITDMSLEELEQAELEEIIDLVHYRLAKLYKHSQATTTLE